MDEEALRSIVNGTAGEGFFKTLVQNLARALHTRGAWVTEYMPDQHRLKLNVLGGCCGTDHRHLEEICKACLEGRALSRPFASRGHDEAWPSNADC